MGENRTTAAPQQALPTPRPLAEQRGIDCPFPYLAGRADCCGQNPCANLNQQATCASSPLTPAEWARVIRMAENSLAETRRNWPPGVAELETIVAKLKEMAAPPIQLRPAAPSREGPSS